MSPSPGVPLRGNYCARRGSVSAASCFLSPTLWPVALSWESRTGFLLHSTYVYVRVCAQSCIPACMFACSCIYRFCFLPLSLMTDWQQLCIYWCVGVYLYTCALCHCVCVCVFADSSPPSKFPAGLPLSRHSVCHGATFKQELDSGIIAGCGQPLFQSAATLAALTHTHSVSACLCVGFCLSAKQRESERGGHGVEKRGKPWRYAEVLVLLQPQWLRECSYNHCDHSILTRLAPFWASVLPLTCCPYFQNQTFDVEIPLHSKACVLVLFYLWCAAIILYNSGFRRKVVISQVVVPILRLASL